MAEYRIIDGKYFFSYDASGGSCFGSYPDPTYIIKDIDAKILLTALGIKNENGLKWALDRLPHADNDIIRLKEFCDKIIFPITMKWRIKNETSNYFVLAWTDRYSDRHCQLDYRSLGNER